MPRITTYAAIKATIVLKLSYRYDRALVQRWQRIERRLQVKGLGK